MPATGTAHAGKPDNLAGTHDSPCRQADLPIPARTAPHAGNRHCVCRQTGSFCRHP
jgi:hypothetical protein